MSRHRSPHPFTKVLALAALAAAVFIADTDALAGRRARARRWAKQCHRVTHCQPNCCSICSCAGGMSGQSITEPHEIAPDVAGLPKVGELESRKSPEVRFAIYRTDLRDDDEEHDRSDPAADCPPDIFCGTARKKAKTSIASAAVEDFSNLDDLLDSLESDDDMIDREPPISHGASSDRVEEEQRNVAVDAFLYAASGEEDNDFHLIIGNDLPGAQREYMNVEISGLPASGPFRDALEDARNQFKDFFEDDLPGSSYDKYVPAIPVRISGSLFYDISHRPGAVGPRGLKPETAWEIHPITSIEFEP